MPLLQSALASLRGTGAYQRTLAEIRAGRDLLCLDGLWGGSTGLLLAALAEDLARPVAAVVPGDEEAEDLAEDAAALGGLGRGGKAPRVEPFPGGISLLEEPHSLEAFERLRVLSALRDRPPPALAVPASALLLETPDPASLARAEIRLETGKPFSPERLVEALVASGLERLPRVQGPGELARRGGIVDCFVPPSERPLRIEWDGDVVCSIRTFDPLTQGSLKTLDRATLALAGGGAGKGPAGSGGAVPVLAHLDPKAILLLLEPAEVQRRVEALRRDPAIAARTPWGWERPAAELARFQRLLVTPVGGPADAVVFPVRSMERFAGTLPQRLDLLRRIAERRQPVALFVRSAAEADRFRRLCEDAAVRWDRLEVVEGKGVPSRGFEIAEGERPLFLTYEEVFHLKRLRRPSPVKIEGGASQALDDLSELSPGDLVVHELHGVGIYRGLELLGKDRAAREHLKLEFAGKAALYVPVEEVGLVSRYVGSGLSRPPLSSLKGGRWRAAREQVRTATEAFAKEMLRILALREAHPADALAADEELLRAFEAAFPWSETADQTKAWAEIRCDLAARRPMDRLLCGDVGFGKTELAIRAAFQAVSAGSQVAVLVPTTVLALQHLRTFQDRCGSFPVRVDMVSRLRTPRERRAVLAAAKKGELDVVIGTHALLQKGVEFHRLGLVIVDEEQKFGVAHKQRITSLRASAHVLSLTATPIPRTLHMAMLGIKEISSLGTPPADRHAIETRVVPLTERVVQEAVVREVARGGQVFYVHNRIAPLKRLASSIERLAPGARVGIAHGQLPPEEIEAAMVAMVEKRTDVLVSTTIIETGLDLPNVNTLLISDAHRYGLAELHQLRGRVGRYKRQAFAYLMIPPSEPLLPAAARRLKAIEEHAELGAGFQIALADLEIRGTGNLLGPEQSGHIAAVGYDLYCKLLAEAVSAAKGEKPRAGEARRARLELAEEAFLPAGYVDDAAAKFEIYRRIARAPDLAEVDRIGKDLADRFGPPPEPARRFLLAARLSLAVGAAGFAAARETEAGFSLEPLAGKDPKALALRLRGSVREGKVEISKGKGGAERLLSLLTG